MVKFEVTWLEDRSDDAVLVELRRVAALAPGRHLTRDMFNSHARISSSTAERRFGSWSEATRRAGLAGALPDYSATAILEDLRRVSNSSQSAPFTMAFYSERGHYSGSKVVRLFGGWREALKAAGIGTRYAGPPITERMKSKPGRAMSEEAILGRIRDVSVRLGRSSLAGADIARNSEISQYLMHQRFGSVSAALKRAGVEHARIGRRYSENDLFENLLRVWTHYGRAPSGREMGRPPSKLHSNTYVKRYGGWRKALKAFVARANSELDVDTGLQPQPDPPMRAEQSEQTESTPVAPTRTGGHRPHDQSGPRSTLAGPARRAVASDADRRNPSIGLRFKVLQRDHFKCVLCGDHPARNAECILHVDHLIPWSKGGKTREGNLRTLCASCNIGRGNRFAD
jgi:hypothetical protein